MKTAFFAIYFLLLLSVTAAAQSLEERLQRTIPTCRDVFSNALEILPALQASGHSDSLELAIDIIEKRCDKTAETFDLRVLLAIEQGNFKVENYYDLAALVNLQHRANAFAFVMGTSYYDKIQSKFYGFTKTWAAKLLAGKKLSPYEQLICNVFTGQEPSPHAYIKKHREEQGYLYNLLQEAEIEARKKPSSYATISAGFWIPTNRLQLLGSHPTIGFQFGFRQNANDIAATIQFRFLQSAHPYSVARNGTTYDLNHFFGGYIGLDYTRYIIRTNNIAIGWLAGAGYDGFDISSNEVDEYLKPLSIGSLNVNTGLRFNYYFKTKGFIGLQGRYNFIDYQNKGGSTLSGDFFSMDLLVGFGR